METADDFLDRYAALPSAERNSAGVRPPSASLRLSVLYRPIQPPPSSSMKRAGVHSDQSLPCQNSFLSRPKKPSIAALSGLQPLATGLATLMWTVPGGAQETGGPYMRDPRHPRHFTDEFKRQIVDLYNAGKPKREIMDEYDLGKSTVERWIKSINATGSPRAACNRTPEQNRILELERENRRLRMEVDVLKQAALIYARK